MDLQERSIMSRRSHLTNLGELHGANREEQVKDVLKCSNRISRGTADAHNSLFSYNIFFFYCESISSRLLVVTLEVSPGLIFFFMET